MAAPERLPAAWMRALERPSEEHSVVVMMGGSFARADAVDMCERVREILAGNEAELIICDVGAVDPDAEAVDALARLQLAAGRAGRRVMLLHACGRMTELVELMGLSDVLPQAPPLAVETKREPEERKEIRRVEEKGDAADPSVGDL